MRIFVDIGDMARSFCRCVCVCVCVFVFVCSNTWHLSVICHWYNLSPWKNYEEHVCAYNTTLVALSVQAALVEQTECEVSYLS